MRRSERWLLGLALVAVAVGCLRHPPSGAKVSATPATDGGILLISAADFDWQPNGRASLWGLPDAGPFARGVMLSADGGGFWHTHSEDKQGVVLEGVLTHYGVGESPETAARLGPGSFFHVPGGLVHATWCYAGPPCKLVYFMRGPFDMNAVDPSEPATKNR